MITSYISSWRHTVNDAFTNELIKIAKVNPQTWDPKKWKSVQDLGTLFTRVRRPKAGIKSAWNDMLPTLAEDKADQGKSTASRALKHLFGQGPHLSSETTSSGLRGAAERASRSGWTGTSRYTKIFTHWS